MLEAGMQAPEFELENSDGERVRLADLLADGPLILYFYPADFTPGCTKEACAIRDIHNDIVAAGLKVVGISPQDRDSHARFQAEHNLPFTLLCDPSKIAIDAYDVDGPFGVGVRRATFLIRPDGVIEDSVLADLRIGRHQQFIENAIRLKSAS